MTVKISKTNTKLGIIPSVNLPPVTTCRPNCPCSQDCYAMRGRFRFHNVRENMKNNFLYYIRDADGYFNDIKTAINNGVISYSYFRWHASGDIVDEMYFERMVKLANELPATSFLIFTKKFEIVNEYIGNGGQIPQNLHIVFSAWGNKLTIDNPYHFPVAHVKFDDLETDSGIPVNAIECSGHCENCLQCWRLENGQAVFFHKH